MAKHFHEAFWGSHGYDSLHRYMKQGRDFCKEFAIILQERADIEKNSAQKLEKLCGKAKTMSHLCTGTLQETWKKVKEFLEAEAQAHRTMQSTFMDEMCKPLKQFVDEQNKARKAAEDAVQKASKAFMDKKNDDAKKKQTTFSKATDHENLYNQLQSNAAKDMAKVETKCRKAEESLMKADQEYKETNKKLEEARQLWEKEMYACCEALERLEVGRLEHMKEVMNKYAENVKSLVPVLEKGCADVSSAAKRMYSVEDIEIACGNYGTGANHPDQILYESFESTLSSSANKERMISGLEKKLQECQVDMQKQGKIQTDVLNLMRTYIKTPDYADEKAMASTGRQLFEVTCMVNYARANHFKLMVARRKMDGAGPPKDPISEFISNGADKSGRPVSSLRIPLDQMMSLGFSYTDVNFSDVISHLPPYLQTEQQFIYSQPSRESLDQLDNSNEWSGPEHDYTEIDETDDNPYVVEDGEYVSTARALFSYQPQQDDELELQEGDYIYVILKESDDWWKGQVNGKIGIFPASYVEETGSPPPTHNGGGQYVRALS